VSDKAGHSIGYAMLGALVLRALARARWNNVTWKTALLAVAITTVYGVSDEWHQAFVPGRSPDPFDVVADMTGAATAVGLAGFVAARRR
jgi:VanZ family protein